MRTVLTEFPWQGKPVMLHSFVARRLSNRLRCHLNSLPGSPPHWELAAHCPRWKGPGCPSNQTPQQEARKDKKGNRNLQIQKFLLLWASVFRPTGWFGRAAQATICPPRRLGRVDPGTCVCAPGRVAVFWKLRLLIWIPLSRPGWLSGFPGRCQSLPLTSRAKT
uniref:Uncharacterized protein n=1 Tax=Pipistrellus kuhlii TaxID=59472 RepID=A0A7J8A7U0_PIPKU|nr:hypothetical protein mPipKuh1_008989 [Pipistrellus kuhlii]